MGKKKNTAIIYGIKKEDKFHYIGKLISQRESGILKSDIQYQYHRKDLQLAMKDSEIVNLLEIPINKWYDEKLSEVVKKHKEDHPLLNADWMKRGGRGYWSGTGGYWIGKKKDAHTIQRLSESKYKKVIQYDPDGNLIKTWNSAKEAAIEVFKDYHIKNGSGCSKLYSLFYVKKNKYLKLKHGSYWFNYDQLMKHFNGIPVKINIEKILEDQKGVRYKHQIEGKKKSLYRTRYTILQYNAGGKLIRKFKNKYKAASALKITHNNVGRLCRGKNLRGPVGKKYYLKYGPKTRQSFII